MMGWPPPGPPRFLGGFPELRCRRRILSVPPGSDRGQGFAPQSLRVPAFSTLGFPHDRWSLQTAPPRPRRPPQAPRTAPPGPRRRDMKTRSSTPGTAAGSPRAAATGQIDRCTRSGSLPRRLGRRWAPDRTLLPTCSPSPGSAPPRPIHWTKGLMYNTRHVGPPRPDVPLPSTSCTAPPGPSRLIRSARPAR